MASSLSSVLSSTCENLKGIFDIVKDDKSDTRNISEKVEKAHLLQLKSFRLSLGKSVTLLSAEVTKLSMLFTKQPPPTASEAQSLLGSIEALVLDIVTISQQLSVSQGRCLREQMTRSIECLGKSLQELLTYQQHDKSGNIQLAMTGFVWEACQDVIKLPSDNVEAVIRILTDEESMLADAAQEIEEEIKDEKQAIQEEEIDNTATWTNQDRELLPPCLGLVHTGRATLKRIRRALKEHGKCDSAENIAQLDAIADAAQMLSPAIDDFVSAIYPPMNRNIVNSSALSVVTVIRQVLTLYQNSHCVNEADKKTWLSFLLRAVDHNNNKVQPLLNPN